MYGDYKVYTPPPPKKQTKKIVIVVRIIAIRCRTFSIVFVARKILTMFLLEITLYIRLRGRAGVYFVRGVKNLDKWQKTLYNHPIFSLLLENH